MNELYMDDRIARAFEQFSDGYNRVYERPAVVDLLAVTPGTRVLDVGCGPGLYTQDLAEAGADVVGMDLSRPMVGHAAAKLRGRAAFVQASFDSNLPFVRGSFDMVLCASAINYAADLKGLLEEFRRVVRSDGAVIVSTRHPMADFMRKGGSYYDVVLETDRFKVVGHGEWEEQFWRVPLSQLCDAFFRAGFLIERLMEPLPSEEMRRTAPDHHAFLLTRPTFIAFRLIPAGSTRA